MSTETSAFVGRPSKLDEFLDRIGVLPDRDIAQLAGVTSENVRTYRKRRQIPAIWRGETAAAAATEAAQAPASPKGRTAAKAKGKPAAKAKGKPAAAVAVAAAPAKAAPATTGRKPKKGRKGKGRARRATKLEPFLARLGLDSDRTIAELAGVSIENVRTYRKRHKIAAQWQQPGAEDTAPAAAAKPSAPAAEKAARPAAAPAAKATAAPAGRKVPRQWAFRVVADLGSETKEYVTFGDDMVDAAERARAKLGADGARAFVTRIEVVGVAL